MWPVMIWFSYKMVRWALRRFEKVYAEQGPEYGSRLVGWSRIDWHVRPAGWGHISTDNLLKMVRVRTLKGWSGNEACRRVPYILQVIAGIKAANLLTLLFSNGERIS